MERAYQEDDDAMTNNNYEHVTNGIGYLYADTHAKVAESKREFDEFMEKSKKPKIVMFFNEGDRVYAAYEDGHNELVRTTPISAKVARLANIMYNFEKW